MANTPFEIPNELRDFAERSVDQARKAFEGFMAAANKATGTVGSTADAVQAHAKDIGSKAMTYAEQNVNAAFDHAKKLMRAKDIQEVMSLQAEFVRTQMSNIQSQANGRHANITRKSGGRIRLARRS